jgi:cell division protein FtsB
VAISKGSEDKSGLPRLWILILVVLAALILGDLNQRMADARRLEEEARTLSIELQELEEEIARLEAEIEIANTEEYVEKWAHAEAKWVREGEVLIIQVSDSAIEPVLAPSSKDEEPVMNNVDEWMRLIFGR